MIPKAFMISLDKLHGGIESNLWKDDEMSGVCTGIKL